MIRSTARPVLVAFLFAIGAGAASAQSVPTNPDTSRLAINQMNTTPPRQAEATGVSQIGGTIAPLSTSSVPRDRAIGGSTAPITGPVPYAQVTAAAPSADAGAQLAPDEASVGPAPSAAVRAQGRVTAVSTPKGSDGCDPQSRRVATVACDRVIEARASEFSSPDHQPLSAEQRLLATQRELRPASVDVSTAARRLANGQIDDSDAALAIASVTLQQTGRPREEEEPAADTSALDAIVAGITSLVTGAPPTP